MWEALRTIMQALSSTALQELHQAVRRELMSMRDGGPHPDVLEWGRAIEAELRERGEQAPRLIS